MSDAAIEIRELRKAYRRGAQTVKAVDGLDLVVGRGEVFGLLGPNGAGKTTTVEICEGLQPPTSGDVQVLGRRWGQGQDQELRERIGVSLQHTEFFEKQTVYEVLRLFRSFYGARSRTVAEAMGAVSLEAKAKQRTKELSGGQRQRLAVATALLGQPELLFLDEPTTGLDPQSRRQLWEVVREYQRGGGTVLLTTHYMDEAEQLCDRVGVVDHGRLIALDTPERLIASLGGDHVMELLVPGAEGRLVPEDVLAVPGVSEATVDGDMVAITGAAAHALLPGLLALMDRQGLALEDLQMRRASLEDVFVHLTGRHLRDGGEAGVPAGEAQR